MHYEQLISFYLAGAKSIHKAKGHKTIEIVIVCLGSLNKQNQAFRKLRLTTSDMTPDVSTPSKQVVG